MMAKPPSATGKLISCRGIDGTTRRVLAADVRFRPAVYGILLDGNQVLLSRSRFTGLWDFPGGGIEPWETLDEGLQREFQEETGLQVKAGPLLAFRDSFFAFFSRPYHSLRFFYRVHRIGGEMAVELAEITALQFWPVNRLPPDMGADERDVLAAVRL
ncbi:MAG: NUDIX domain-containing protein [Thermaerobacter sp.]|nr:NUDIX domain-containing protein [Thermaerobacter sp.]